MRFAPYSPAWWRSADHDTSPLDHPEVEIWATELGQESAVEHAPAHHHQRGPLITYSEED